MTSANAVPTVPTRLPAAVLWVSATLFCTAATAQVFVGMNDGPAVVLSNFQSPHAPEVLIAEDAAPEHRPGRNIDSSDAAPDRPAMWLDGLDSHIRDNARRYRLSESLLLAVIAAESGFNPRAQSAKGAQGLMQLMPETAKRFGASDRFSVEQNLRAGSAYLRWLLDLFGNDVSLALAGYNAGEGAVLRAGRRVPDLDETRRYVPRVLAYERHYAALRR